MEYKTKNSFALESRGTFSERQQIEASWKGWLPSLYVVYNGNKYNVIFWDIVRFVQDYEVEIELGPVFYELNSVFVKSVTLENIYPAVDKLIDDGYFEYILPEKDDTILMELKPFEIFEV